MQPTYFASFLLGADAAAKPPAVREALDEIAQWIFNNPYRPLARPKDWPDGASDPITFPNGEQVQLLTMAGDDDFHTSAIRFEHPDQQGRIWRTDCVLNKTGGTERAVRFAVTVAAGSSENNFVPVSPPSTRPRIVRLLMEKFGGREHYPLKTTFIQIKSSEAEPFSGFLLDSQRTLPIVFVSRRNRDAALLCDPAILADKLVGIAYVCVADDIELSWNLAAHLDNRLNAYDGTVRVYWPRMTRDDPPYRHRWWTQQRLSTIAGSERSLADELLKLIAAASVTRRISGLVRWEDVEREITKRSLQNIQATGAVPATASEEWLRQYELDLAALDDARQALSDASERVREKEEEVRWTRLMRQFGGLAKVDRVGFYAANCSIISAVA